MASEDAEGETRHLLAGSASEAGSRSSTQLYDMEHGTSSTGATGYEYGDSDDEDEFEEEESQEAQGRLGKCWQGSWKMIGRLLMMNGGKTGATASSFSSCCCERDMC